MNRPLLTIGLRLVVLAIALPAGAVEGDGTYDISYLWTPYLDGALEYRELVVEQLGPDVGAHLQVVRGGTGNYGVLYDRGGTDAEEAREVANRHHRILVAAFGGKELLADVLPDKGFARLRHIRYGTAADLAAAQELFAVMAGSLGPEVARGLVVQRAGEGYEVLYRLYGTPDEAAAVAEDHLAALGENGSHIAVVAADAGQAVWDSSTATAQRSAPKPTPVPDSPAPPEPALALRFDEMDQGLRDAVNDYIQTQRGKGVVASDEHTAWVAYDLQVDRTLMAINSDSPLQCASMIKPFVALAFFHEVDRGRFTYGPKSTAQLEAMLQRSNNESTNWFIDQIGGVERTRKILADNYGEMLAGLELVEKIPPGGGTYLNKATAEDYARFLRALWRDELPHSDEIKRAMNLPNRDRIYSGVPVIPVGTAVYDKTGTTARLCGDMGILVAHDSAGQPVPYVIVGIIEKDVRHPRLYEFARSRGGVIREVSGLVYSELESGW